MSRHVTSRHQRPNRQSGQTLILLLAFMATALVITTSAATVTIANIQAASKYTQGEDALSMAESGADNAMLRLLRDPNYTGETLTIGTGTATITVSGSPSYTITSVGATGSFKRTIQVTASRVNNVIAVAAWKEIP